MSTTATPDGDGSCSTAARRHHNGPIADVITVYAELETGDGASGITAFLVPTDTPGFHVGPPIAKLGLNTSRSANSSSPTAASRRAISSASQAPASSSSST